MLNKQERAAIAERIKSIGYVDEKTFYESIVGKCVPSTTSYSEDLKTIFRVVLDLCDTSNMIELPRDKDGEVIKVGDMVFNKRDYRAYRVRGYEFKLDRCAVMLGDDTNDCKVTYLEPVALTHKKPVTIESLVKELTDLAAADYGTPMVVKRKLEKIAEQLESLGDSDD